MDTSQAVHRNGLNLAVLLSGRTLRIVLEVGFGGTELSIPLESFAFIVNSLVKHSRGRKLQAEGPATSAVAAPLCHIDKYHTDQGVQR